MRAWLLLLAFGCSETGLNAEADVEQPLREDRDPDPEPVDPDAPVADAGEDQAGHPLSTVTLDGSRSVDPLGGTLIPTWRLARAPKGSRARLERADTMNPTFYADLVGEYVAELGVRNEAGLEDATPDQVRVVVTPGTTVYVQLSWDEAVDLDLHVLPEDDPLWGPTDCTWCNLEPDWGQRGEAGDDPSLDADAIDGFGPETVTLAAPADGRFRAVVDYYGEGGDVRCVGPCAETVATLDVYVAGDLVASASQTLVEAGETWTALAVDWPSADVEIIDEIGVTYVDDCQ